MVYSHNHQMQDCAVVQEGPKVVPSRVQPEQIGQSTSCTVNLGGFHAQSTADVRGCGRAPSFVSAGASSSKAPSGPTDNLASDLQIEAAKEDEADIAMELDSDDEDERAAGHVRLDQDESSEDDDDGSGAEQDRTEDLAPVPGLAPSPPPNVVPEPDIAPSTPLAFAPRGIGSRGRGGAGIGSRAGIGGGAGIGARSSSSAAPAFASATSASMMSLGGVGVAKPTIDAVPSGSQSPMTDASTPRIGLGAGIGATRAAGGGIGSRPSLADSLRDRLAAQQTTFGADLSPSSMQSSPSSSAGASPVPEAMSTNTTEQQTIPRERRSFLPTASTQAGGTSFVPKKISKKEQQHFAKLESSGSLGLKMLQKMGWKNGSGLGANEQGIVTPVGEGQKVRERGKGLSSGERSAGAIAEAARM